MIQAKKHGILLEKTSLGFEIDGALNPAVIQENGRIHLFYRAVRTGNYSTIGYAELSDPVTVKKRNKKPLLIPEHPYESQGVEDPRITKIDDTFYMTYTAYNKVNALGAVATSKDLKTFHKLGTITPNFTYREYNHLIECCPKLNDKYFFHYKYSRNMVWVQRWLRSLCYGTKICCFSRRKSEVGLPYCIEFTRVSKSFILLK